MNRYAYFCGYICTANADGSIPMNSRMVAQIHATIEPPALAAVLAQANLAAQVFEALRDGTREDALRLYAEFAEGQP